MEVTDRSDITNYLGPSDGVGLIDRVTSSSIDTVSVRGAQVF